MLASAAGLHRAGAPDADVAPGGRVGAQTGALLGEAARRLRQRTPGLQGMTFFYRFFPSPCNVGTSRKLNISISQFFFRTNRNLPGMNEFLTITRDSRISIEFYLGFTCFRLFKLVFTGSDRNRIVSKHFLISKRPFWFHLFL